MSMLSGGQETTDTAVQNEIVNLTNVVTTSLPIMENLNASLFTCTATSDALSQGRADVLNANLFTCAATSDALSQGQADVLNANLFTCAATSDALSQSQADVLNANLLTTATTSDALSQALFGSLNGNLNISFNGLNNTLNLSLTGLTNTLDLSFAGLNNNLTTSVSGLQNNLVTSVSGLQNNMATSISGLQNNMVTSISGLQNNMITSISGLQNNMATSISGLQNNMITSISGLQNNMATSISGLQNNMNTNSGKVETQLSGISSYLKGVFGDNKMPSEYFNNVINDSLDIESIKLAKTGNNLARIGNVLTATIFAYDNIADIAEATANLPFGAGVPIGIGLLTGAGIVTAGIIAGAMVGNVLFADGGYPSMGQMFIAREAGPELVGKIGGRNAVMNNNQIVESVSTGVYSAVKSALNDGGGSVIQVFIGNYQLDEYIVRGQQRRSLQTNGVYA